MAYGLFVVYSASLTIADASAPRQAFGALLGFVLAAFAYGFDYRRLCGMTTALFVIDCLLMVAPFIPGLSYNANGITGWIRVPGIGLTFQTSELAKLVTIEMCIRDRCQGRARYHSR